LSRSLRFRLLTAILISFLLGWLVISGFAWWRATVQASALFDHQLAQLADLLAVITTHEAEEKDLQQFEADLHQSGNYSTPLFQVWSHNGLLLIRGPRAPLALLSADTLRGYSDETLAGSQLRVYSRYTVDNRHLIQVAQEVSDRQAELQTFVRGSLTPLLLALPMIAIIWFAIDRAMAPLNRLASEIDSRTTDNLEPIHGTEIPDEVVSLVNAVNALFDRLQSSLEKYCRFAADAAHELRTPLAGSAAQIQAALDATDPQERRNSLQQALSGLSRLHRLMEQLLIMARLEPDMTKTQFSEFDLHNLLVEVTSEFAPRLLQRGIELELNAPQPVIFHGIRDLLAITVSNLLDNALRAVSPGGFIKVSLRKSRSKIVLQVEDSGHGIPEAEKAWVFERFHRIPGTEGEGSGLGLSIVSSIVELHSGSISLLDREPDQGLCIMIEFPIKT